MRSSPFIAAVIAGCLLPTANCISQGCCAGGSGSPIAGGASQGVLLDRQMELASNFQYISSSRFLTKDIDTVKLFENFNSKYLYTKIAYGFTKDLTVSLEAGYFFNKTQTGLFDSITDKSEEIKSSGTADLILFPRYDVLNRTTETKRVEITLGLGYKIPLGKHNDSTLVYTNPVSGQKIFTTSPPLVQPTNGSHDIIFYSFFFRGFPQHNFRLFANTLYIKKGWNSLGEKFGDYIGIGLFAGKTFYEKLGVTLQLKGEHIGKMKPAENVDLLAFYNIDTASTGSRKISLLPQVSFSYKSFTFFVLYELPLYEYVNGSQLASQHQFTFGISYRFFTVKSSIPKSGEDVYSCSMKCPEGISNKPGKCRGCGMELIKEK
ncbi:MAG: hypothetical protein EPN85_14185 [Bacteroidetes bacterium]|nr:MAG: hypothetical protein EPN85_14185 [Bacteroidota bacterium]